MKKITISLLFAVFLTGCLSTEHVRVYPGPALSPDKTSLIKGITGEFYTRLLEYAPLTKNPKDLKYQMFGTVYSGRPGSAEMMPGKYMIRMNCMLGTLYSTPQIPAMLKAGHTYEFMCERVPSQADKMRVTFIRSYKTEKVKSK